MWELPDDDPFAEVEMAVKNGDDVHPSIVRDYYIHLREYLRKKRKVRKFQKRIKKERLWEDAPYP